MAAAAAAAGAAAEGIHMDYKLLKALQRGDVRAVDRLFSQDVSVAIGINVADQARRRSCRGVTIGGNSALHIAADFGHLKLAKLICTRDSSLLTVRNVAGETPLHCAARAGADQIVSHFISVAKEKEDGSWLEAVLHAKDQEGKTALYTAAHEGHAAAARVLMNEDPALAAIVDKEGISPLYAAVMSGSLKVVQILIGSHAGGGEKPGAAANNGVSTLCTNVPSGSLGAVQILIGDERDAAARADEGDTREASCASGGDERDAAARADEGDTREASYAGPNGQTALHAAAMIKNREIAEELLQWKPILTKEVDSSRSTPIHYLAATSNLDKMRQLLNNDPSPAYLSDSKGLCPIHVASRMGGLPIIRELINCCPDMGELVDGRGGNFLHVAIQYGRANIVRGFVCRSPMFVRITNARDFEGNTPLHLAVESKNQTIVSLLLENISVRPNITNKNCKTPLDLAIAGLDVGLLSILSPSTWIFMWLICIGAIYGPHRRDQLVDEMTTKQDQEKEQKKYETTIQSLGIVSVLIATVTFAAAFTMPGGYIADDHKNGGTPTLATKHAFKAFIFSDSLAFICSITATFLLLYVGSLKADPSLPWKFIFSSAFFLNVAVQGLVIAFTMAVYVVLAPVNTGIAITICTLSVTSTLFYGLSDSRQLHRLQSILWSRRVRPWMGAKTKCWRN